MSLISAGETGTVLQLRHAVQGANGPTNLADSSDAWLAVLLLDSGQKQVEAFVRHLTASSEVRRHYLVQYLGRA